MKMFLFTVFRLVSYDIFVLICVVSYVSGKDSCNRKEFTEYKNISYSGNYIMYKGPWRYRDCVRSCRMYVDCVAFTMQWTVTGELGQCGTIRRGQTAQFTVSTGVSFFG